MKNKQKALAEMKYTLRKKQERGIREVLWSLTPAQREYVEQLGYYVTPALYEIRTRRIENIKYSNSSILKEVNASWKKGMKVFYRKLNLAQVKILQESHIQFKCIKYQIIL